MLLFATVMVMFFVMRGRCLNEEKKGASLEKPTHAYVCKCMRNKFYAAGTRTRIMPLRKLYAEHRVLRALGASLHQVGEVYITRRQFARQVVNVL